MDEQQIYNLSKIVFDSKDIGSKGIYTYLNNSNYPSGSCCLVSLGNRELLGYILSNKLCDSRDNMNPEIQLKPISESILDFKLPEHLVELWKWMADEYLCSFSSALGVFFPPGGKKRIKFTWTVQNKEELNNCSDVEIKSIHNFFDGNDQVVEHVNSKISPKLKTLLGKLRKKGVLARKASVDLDIISREVGTKYFLSLSDSCVTDFISKEKNKKHAQCAALESLVASEQGDFTIEELASLCSVSKATVRAMIKSGLLKKYGKSNVLVSNPKKLNQEQFLAFQRISSSITENQSKHFLLFGITGSGKTEVYMQAIAVALQENKSVLYLVPEIALTAELVGVLRSRFGKEVTVLHSGLNDNIRLKNWLNIKSGETRIIVGPRSALFSPIENLGLVIMDEEHESSYKQEVGPYYHSKNVVKKLSEICKCSVVYGSATPSVETYQEALSGDIELLTLSKRANLNSVLPKVEIEDLTSLYKKGSPSLIGPTLDGYIKENLLKKEQTILFLNRRAYAPTVLCRDCGYMVPCPNCVAYLSYHKKKNILKCHHCDYQLSLPKVCPDCSSEKLAPVGLGVEKVEEMIKNNYPDARVARVDRDVARKKNVLQDIFAGVREGEVDILVGTQMIAKGLDFPNVTLVGVIAADLSLSIPDYRSSERTFQLLTQVSGRAGRSFLPGRVVVQTFNSTHPAIAYAVEQNYIGFFNHVIKEREAINYPPYSRLINILIKSKNQKAMIESGKKLALDIKQQYQCFQILGPAVCVIEKIDSIWRSHLLIKMNHGASYEGITEIVKSLLNLYPDIDLTIDVDPGGMM